MPKSNQKDVYYFSHDCNARNDSKVLALRSVYGPEGYGVYFMLLEILREQKDYRLTLTPFVWNTLSMQLGLPAERVEEIVTSCCDVFVEDGAGLLVRDQDKLWSPSLCRRMALMQDASERARNAANKRWAKEADCQEDADAMQMDADAMQVNEKKEKEKKQKHMKTEERKAEQTKAVETKAEQTEGEQTPPPRKNDPHPELRKALDDLQAASEKAGRPLTPKDRSLLLLELSQASSDPDRQADILRKCMDAARSGTNALPFQLP